MGEVLVKATRDLPRGRGIFMKVGTVECESETMNI